MAVLSRVRRFVPEFGGNKDLPEAEQVVAKMKAVDVYTRQVHIRKFLKMNPADITQEMMGDKGSKEIKDILFANVVGFENLVISDEATTEPRPATIEDLWNMGEFGMCMELFTAILNSSQLSKEKEKNFESPSGSTPLLEEGVGVH